MGKRIVVRADDVGYTLVNNIGAFETFKNGIATAADVMLDTPGTADALEKLRDMPWISVGWHTHFWGEPLLDRKLVPTLIDEKTGHFRKDIWRAEDLSYDELVAEMRVQLDMCVRILGRAPDTSEFMMGGGSVFGKAKAAMCGEYGIITGFERRVRRTENGFEFSDVKPEYADRNIYWMDPGSAYHELFSDSIAEIGKYDPIRYYTEDRGHTAELPEDSITGQAWHPGYVDYYMCRLGDQGPKARNFLECRPIDTHALCSDELKAWVRENKVELMNFKDAILGTHDYQEHLREIGSDLCML